MARNNIAMKLSICTLNFSLNTKIFDELRRNVQYTYSRKREPPYCEKMTKEECYKILGQLTRAWNKKRGEDQKRSRKVKKSKENEQRRFRAKKPDQEAVTWEGNGTDSTR